MNSKAMGERIKKRRTELKLTLQQVADELDLNKSTIQRYESGNTKDIKLPIVESIARTLNVDPLWIVGKTDIQNRSEEYERLTYLANLYFDGVMKWSEDSAFNEQQTLVMREHFSDMLFRYKEILVEFSNSQHQWEVNKDKFVEIYPNLSPVESRELYLKNQLEQPLRQATEWIDAFPSRIAWSEKED